MAKSLCPDLQTVSYDFDGYQTVAKSLYDVVAKYTLEIQAVSCDEMLVDLTTLLQDTKSSATDVVENLRQEVFESTGCTASVGLGPNVLLAKLATKRAKPDGIFQLKEVDDIQDFMQTVELRDLPGVGRKTLEKLKEISGGLKHVVSFTQFPKVRLHQHLG